MSLPSAIAAWQRGELPLAELLGSLRSYGHSLHASERDRVVDILGAIDDPHAQRDLLRFYKTCQWRSTRRRIIRALSRFPTGRTIEFLIGIASDETDMPLCEEALWALGRSRHPLAARYLNQAYLEGSELKRPYVVAAIGQLPDGSLAPLFLEALPEALARQQVLLAKHLMLTLAELRHQAALPLLEEILDTQSDRALTLCAVIALGRLSRDTRALDAVERRLRRDLFEYRLWEAAQAQIRLRASWALEDYLEKLFTAEVFDPLLAVELNAFPLSDLVVGLEVFSDREHLPRMCQVLSVLSGPAVPDLYATRLHPDALSDDELRLALASIGRHFDSAALPYLLRCLGRALQGGPLLSSWLSALCTAVPEADELLQDLVAETGLALLSADQQVSVLNELVHLALCLAPSARRRKACVRTLERILGEDVGERVRARALRALGQLRADSQAAMAYLRERVRDADLSRSCLYYLERCPSRRALAVLEELIDDEQFCAQHREGILGALAVQESLPGSPATDELLRRSLAADAGAEVQRLALTLLSVHPRRDALRLILPYLEAEEQLQIAAIIALKGYGDDAVEPLRPLLHSPSESVVARTLDTLSRIPGLRSAGAVVTFLEERFDDEAVVEKVLRCLDPPPSPALARRVDALIAAHPAHPLLEGLVALRDHLSQEPPGGGAAGEAPAEELGRIDTALSQLIPGYLTFDGYAKAALRTAELPFVEPALFEGSIDKSVAVIQYCKAIDLVLDKRLGEARLYPALEQSIAGFQSVLYAAGLSDESVRPEQLIAFFRLQDLFSPETLPLGKVQSLAREILSGRIVQARRRAMDGLRAWGVVLLLFSRPTEHLPAPLPLPSATDEELCLLGKRLCVLQDLRNPVAHRQILLRFEEVDAIRLSVLDLFQLLPKIL